MDTIASELAAAGCLVAFPESKPAFDATPQMFVDRRCRRIVELCLELEEYDATILRSKLDADDTPFLASLSGTACSPWMLGSHLDVVRRSFAARRVSPALTRAQAMILEGDIEAASAAIAEAQSAAVAWAPQAEEDEGVGVVASRVLERAVAPPAARGENVGLRAFDVALGGLVFAPTRLVVLAARPGVGKTALSLQIACHVARRKRVLYWCGEMPAEELVARQIASLSGVPLTLVLRGGLNRPDAEAAEKAAIELSDLNLEISTRSSMTVERLDVLVSRMAATVGKPSLLVVDYLQRMKSSSKRSREEEVGETARSLKEMARRHNICVLALAQLNRAIEGRTDRKPKMSDLRESGQIEQEADLIGFLDRPGTWSEGAPKDLAYLDVAKFRHGPSGSRLDLSWDGPTQRFRDPVV